MDANVVKILMSAVCVWTCASLKEVGLRLLLEFLVLESQIKGFRNRP